MASSPLLWGPKGTGTSIPIPQRTSLPSTLFIQFVPLYISKLYAKVVLHYVVLKESRISHEKCFSLTLSFTKLSHFVIMLYGHQDFPSKPSVDHWQTKNQCFNPQTVWIIQRLKSKWILAKPQKIWNSDLFYRTRKLKVKSIHHILSVRCNTLADKQHEKSINVVSTSIESRYYRTTLY